MTMVIDKKVANTKRRKMSRVRLINTVRFFWWLKEVIKEWTVRICKASLEKFGVFLVASGLILYHIGKVIAPVAKIIWQSFAWIVTHLIWVVWFLTAGIFLGKIGTKKVFNKELRHKSEVPWINVNPIPVLVWGVTLLALAFIIIPETSLIEKKEITNQKTVTASGNSVTEKKRDLAILYVESITGTQDAQVELSEVQKTLAKEFIDHPQNVSELEKIYTILKNGGTTEDLRNAGISHPERYSFDDEDTVHNVNYAIYGKSL